MLEKNPSVLLCNYNSSWNLLGKKCQKDHDENKIHTSTSWWNNEVIVYWMLPSWSGRKAIQKIRQKSLVGDWDWSQMTQYHFSTGFLWYKVWGCREMTVTRAWIIKAILPELEFERWYTFTRWTKEGNELWEMKKEDRVLWKTIRKLMWSNWNS